MRDFQREPLRLGVLFSGAGSTLANLIERIGDGRLRGTRIVAAVSSRSGVRGVEIARSAGLVPAIIRVRDFVTSAELADAVAQELDSHQVELVLMAGYLCHWRYPARYEGRILNIHPALLPRHGGKGMWGHHVHEAVLAAGDRESGCTVHLVDQEYDHGPVLAQARVPVVSGDTAEMLAARVGVAERELYPAVVQRIVETGGRLPVDPVLFSGWQPPL